MSAFTMTTSATINSTIDIVIGVLALVVWLFFAIVIATKMHRFLKREVKAPRTPYKPLMLTIYNHEMLTKRTRVSDQDWRRFVGVHDLWRATNTQQGKEFPNKGGSQ